MQSRPVILDIDERDIEIVKVPLGRSTDTFATMDKDDYIELRSLGVTGNFYQLRSGGYVACSAPKAPGKIVLVARLILDCGPGETARFKSHDLTDLRRCNLVKFKSGWGLNRARDFLKKKATNE